LRDAWRRFAFDRNPSGVPTGRYDEAAYVQGCVAASANDELDVTFRTLRFDRRMTPADAAGVAKLAGEHGATISLRSSERIDRTYALLGVEQPTTANTVGMATGAKLYETAIIALAVYPAPVQALPALLEAFGGAGRPSGVLECSSHGQGVVIEWDPQRCSAAVVSALVDVELRRFGGARTAELLSPLPETIVARIAAEGLGAPQLTPDRLLETLLDRAGLNPDA
jgi:hypothetical protein